MNHRVVKVIVTLLVIAAVVPAVLYAVPRLAGADHAYVVLSGSMVPFFKPGDVIFVKDAPPGSFHEGDVLTFRVKAGSTTLVTHRIVEVLHDGDSIRYRTKGDANEDPDPFVVKQDMVVGKYAFQIPWWGYTVKVLHSKIGYVGLILVPSLILMVTQLVALYREFDELDKRRKKARELV